MLERFQIAREAGFEAIECPTTPEAAKAEEILAASKKSGLPIHSVMNQEHWRSPLSSADPAVVEKSMEGMRTSLRNAKLWGADTVLLVPAVVNPETTYAQAWERSQRQIRKLIPLAEELKVIIGIEEVWNKFLLSPLEFARYVDEFQTPVDPRVLRRRQRRASTGIRRTGSGRSDKRIVKLHFKDFSFTEADGGVHPAAGRRYRLEGGARRASPTSGIRARRRWNCRRRRRLSQGSQSPLRQDSGGVDRRGAQLCDHLQIPQAAADGDHATLGMIVIVYGSARS